MYSQKPILHAVSLDKQVHTTDFAGLFSILRRRLISIALITLLSIAAALVYLSLASPVYTATTTLFIDPRPRKIVTDDIVQRGLTADAALVESQVPIITSDGVLSRVVRTLELDKDPEFAPPDSSGALLRIKELIRGRREPVDAQTIALESLSKVLRVKRAQKTYVVDIQAESTSALKAARIANAVAAAYLADQTAVKAAETRRANELIDARLGELREQVRIAETRIDEYRKANRLLTTDGKNVAEEQLGKLNAELASARAVAAEARARYEQAQASARDQFSYENLPDAVKSGLVQRLRDQYAQVSRREAALRSQLHDRHPVLVDVRAQVREISSQIRDEVNRIALAAKSEHEIAANRVQELLRTIEKTKAEVALSDTSQIMLRELQREAEASRELLTAFLARAKETQEQTNITTPEARIVSKAAVPSRPSRPSGVLILAFALFGGLGLGVARALAADHFNRSIASESDLERAGGPSFLAALPEVTRSGLLSRVSGRNGVSKDLPNSAAHGDILSAIAVPRGVTAVRFKQAVLRLLGRVRAGVRPDQSPAIMVVAPHAAAGSTSTALALAYAAAMSGDRVLLVDATSAKPDLSRIFSADFPKGETIRVDKKEDLERILVHDSRSGMAFLPAAYFDLRVLKADQRRRLVSGLTALAGDFDLVVYDGGDLHDDGSAMTLLPAVDRLIVVTRAGRTTRDQLAELGVVLEPARDRIAGAVLNRIAD